ncbi:MAG: Asp-tRNA(Asn)/Glu-tRNA(Gln) amidotransferase subunit GatB [bacterium]
MANAAPARLRFIPVIGFEVHAQLKTDSKLFCGCGTSFAAPPNTLTCPVCLGLPGSLPVMNRRAVEMAVKLALALECEINNPSYQARKNYYYPDLPKGYQISQYKVPIALNGRARFWMGDHLREVRIKRVQLEEDTAKMSHQGEQSLIDYNRSGVPLAEIVTEPDFTSAEEGVAYLKELRNLVRTLGACDGNMEEGSLRCEPNVSIATGDPARDKWKVELKNLGSFRAVERAIKFELDRQGGVIESGERVPQETRGFNEANNETFAMRSKEFEEDYRYFADPDLPLLVLDKAWVKELLPTNYSNPWLRAWQLAGKYIIQPKHAMAITTEPGFEELFAESVRIGLRKLLDTGRLTLGSNINLCRELASNIGEIIIPLAKTAGGLKALNITPLSIADLAVGVRTGRIEQSKAKAILIALAGGTLEGSKVSNMTPTGTEDEELLSASVFRLLTDNPEVFDYFGRALNERVKILTETKNLDATSFQKAVHQVFNWTVHELMARAKDEGWEQTAVRILPESLARLTYSVDAGSITATVAKSELERMNAEAGPAYIWSLRPEITKISDTSEIEKAVEAVLALPEAASMIASFKKGKETALTALMGLVMKHTRGRADPKTAEKILREKLTRR